MAIPVQQSALPGENTNQYLARLGLKTPPDNDWEFQPNDTLIATRPFTDPKPGDEGYNFDKSRC